jgi:hypothetical protein
MHVTESPPAKIWGSRPTGLGGVVVSASLAPQHSVFFGPFLSGCFFPPNDRAQNHAQENPLLVLFLLAQKCLWTLNM